MRSSLIFVLLASILALERAVAHLGDDHDHKHSPPGFVHNCIQDSLPDLNVLVPQEHNVEEMKRSFAQGGSQFSRALRIKVDYSNLRDSYSCTAAGQTVSVSGSSYTCTTDDVLDSTKETFLNELVTAAVDFYQGVLNVYPIDPVRVITGPTCGDLNIPGSYANISDADFLLVVTARPTSSPTTLATAVTCQSDTVTNTNIVGRPTVGTANFGPRNIVPNQALERDKQIGVAIHEMGHALGFSSNAFSRGYITWTTPTSFVAMPSSQITVVAAARAHFGCNSLVGGELESAGGAGTAGAHWSKRFYMNEYMTGTASDFPLYSQMTFSLFEDTGYYSVNWNQVSTLVWGRGQGCAFADSCASWPDTTQVEGYRCTAADSPAKQPRIPYLKSQSLFEFVPLSLSSQCTFDLRSVGQCSDGVLINPLIGTCTYYIDRTNGRCDNPYDDPLTLNLDSGEVHDRNSRCFISNVLKLSNQIAGNGALTNDYKCYETICAGKQSLKLGIDGIWYDCPYAGGSVEPIYYGGKVQCKAGAADILCLDAVEDPTWPLVTSVTPTIGGPLTPVTITGSNFLQTTSVTVKVHGDCTDVVVVSDTEITCTIPDKTQFASLDFLSNALSGSTVKQALTIVVKDSRGYTGLLTNGFTVEMEVGAATKNWIEQNTILFVCLIVGFVIFIVIIAVVIWRCCCRKSEGEKREARMNKRRHKN